MGIYRLDKLVMVKLSSTHIPYFGYIIVVGPRGGKYLLDQLNTEVMTRYAVGDIITEISYCGAIHRHMIRENRAYYTDICIDDGNIGEFAKKESATLLKRKNGIKQAMVIGRGLDMYDKSSLVDIMIGSRGGI